MQNNKINKILIIRLSALGDAIHTLPLAYSLRKHYPDAQIDWIVEDKAEKFIVNNPLLNNVYVLERKKWKKSGIFRKITEYFKIISKIRHEKYDVVIDTQQLFKSSLIMGLSKGKRKITLDFGRELSWLFANEIIKTGKKQFDINFHVVNRNLQIAKYLGCNDLIPKFVIPDLRNEYSKEIKNILNKCDGNKKTIVIAPATTWENKHWTVQGWVDVINEFKNTCNIIITASEKEKELISAILSSISDKENIIDLSGQTSLSDIVYVDKNADVVISPDSGSAHIAWAVGKPAVVTLFFATSSGRTAPFGDKYCSVQADTPCSPCMKKHCKRINALNCCKNGIKPADVINIVKKVLQ